MQIASGRPGPRLTTTRATVGLGAALAAALLVAPACRRSHRPVPAAAAPDAGAPVVRVAVTGGVADRRGRPIPEARVLLFPLEGGGAPAETSTDREGRFRAAQLAPGPYRVLVEAAGFPTTQRAPITAPTAGLSVELDGEGRTIVGQVERAGAPVPGARVLLAPDDGGPIRETTSRAGGGFAFGGLGSGRYALRATGEGAASRVVRAVEAKDETAGPPVRLVLVPGQVIEGRVVDDAGAGLEQVEVRVETSGVDELDDPLPAIVRTGAGGRFTTGPLPPAPYRVSAVRPGYLLRKAQNVTVGPDAAPAAVALALVRGARLSGRVRDGTGAPAAGARVRCAASAIEDLAVQSGPLLLAAEAAALPSNAGRALGTTRVAVADRDGRFAVEDLVPGRYRVEIAQSGAEPFQTEDFVLAPGERRDLGQLLLRAGIPVAGRVVDESGVPIEGARVVVTGDRGNGAAASSASAVTDAGGRFALALPAGSWRLAASASGRGGAQVPVELRPGSAPAPIELKLGRTEASLEGLVRDDGGRPLARARLAVFPADPAASPVGSGSTDVGGHFAIGSLPAGDLRLEVRHPDYPTTTVALAGGRYALVTVPFPGGVSGEVRARSTGAQVTRGRVEAVGPGGATASADLRKTSTFTLMRLAPGHWRLTVTAPGFRPAERELDVAAAAALGEPSLRDVRVELDPG